MPDAATLAVPIGILRCSACGTLDAGPRLLCPQCHAAKLVPEQTPGLGRLLSWTVIRRPAAQFRELAPIGIAIVTLDAGVTITGRLASPEALHRVGERVAAIGQDNDVGIFEVVDG
jgi:uncharacterized OB-fold protein